MLSKSTNSFYIHLFHKHLVSSFLLGSLSQEFLQREDKSSQVQSAPVGGSAISRNFIAWLLLLVPVIIFYLPKWRWFSSPNPTWLLIILILPLNCFMLYLYFACFRYSLDSVFTLRKKNPQKASWRQTS